MIWRHRQRFESDIAVAWATVYVKAEGPHEAFQIAFDRLTGAASRAGAPPSTGPAVTATRTGRT